MASLLELGFPITDRATPRFGLIREAVLHANQTDFVIDIEGCNHHETAYELSASRPDGTFVLTAVIDWEMSIQDLCTGEEPASISRTCATKVNGDRRNT
jgi:hypothetical protein